MHRLYRAFINSYHALKYLLCHEKAVQQESIVFIISLPVAFFLARSGIEFLILVFSVLFVLIIEIINTAIEAVCDAVTRDYRQEIKIAKDSGSLAVLISIIMALSIWGYTLISHFIG